MKLTVGIGVSAAFRARVLTISKTLGLDRHDLTASLGFETAETFRPDWARLGWRRLETGQKKRPAALGKTA